MYKGKTTVGIIDDEQDGRDYIQLLLANEFPELEITFIGTSMNDAVNLLYKHQVDILFLDVQLQDGNIFSLWKKMDTERLQSQLIFVKNNRNAGLNDSLRGDCINMVSFSASFGILTNANFFLKTQGLDQIGQRFMLMSKNNYFN